MYIFVYTEMCVALGCAVGTLYVLLRMPRNQGWWWQLGQDGLHNSYVAKSSKQVAGSKGHGLCINPWGMDPVDMTQASTGSLLLEICHVLQESLKPLELTNDEDLKWIISNREVQYTFDPVLNI